MIILVDNFDSFTYNLRDLLALTGEKVQVIRNDALNMDEIKREPPRAFVLSPGPGKPKDAGQTPDLVRALMGKVPILGVCLGHQALAEALGGKVVRAAQAMYGKTSALFYEKRSIFGNLPIGFRVMRYHSLIVEENTGEFEIIARTKSGEPMALVNEKLKAVGVQFHPESILSEFGARLILNWYERYAA